jgi:hypothetical protein
VLRADERDAAARDDALFDGGAGRVQRVLDAGLLLLHLGFGGGADVDHGHAAGELRLALLELLLVVVRRGLLDGDRISLMRPWISSVAGAVDDRGVVLVDHDALGAAEVGEDGVLELEADFLGDDLALGEDFAMSSSIALRRSPKPGAFTARRGACRAACSRPAWRAPHPRHPRR